MFTFIDTTRSGAKGWCIVDWTPAFGWCLDLRVRPRFRLPNGKGSRLFLLPFRLVVRSRCIVLFLPWHASISTHGRPYGALEPRASKEEETLLHCVALLGLAASLAPSPVIYPFSDAPLHVYIRCCSNSYQCSSLLFFIDRWSQILATVLPILSFTYRGSSLLAVCSIWLQQFL